MDKKQSKQRMERIYVPLHKQKEVSKTAQEMDNRNYGEGPSYKYTPEMMNSTNWLG
jgi:hypothetical protein